MPDNETPRGNLPMAVPRDFPDALPLIIMQDQVVFPLALVPISIRSESEFRLINDVHNGDRLVAIAAAKDGEESKQSMADVYDVGCIARIVQVQHGHNGHVDVMLQTLKRCRITGFIRREPYPVARILPMEDIIKDKQKLDALAATIKTQMGQLIALSPNIPDGYLTGGSMEQETAIRLGINITLYALTGNYKADQVHIPFILDRLGQEKGAITP